MTPRVRCLAIGTGWDFALQQLVVAVLQLPLNRLRTDMRIALWFEAWRLQGWLVPVTSLTQ